MKEIHDMCELENTSIFPIGDENSAFAQHFDGKSYLNMISTQQVVIGNVTFEAGCRNHWHGAAPDSAFQHLAVEVPGEETSTEWCEAVDENEYSKL